MYIWDDRNDYVELIEGKRSYNRVLLLPYEVRFVQDQEEEIFKFKLQKDSEPFFADSWKLQALQHFSKVAMNKGFKVEQLHFIMTDTVNNFTDRSETKNVLLALYCSADDFKIQDSLMINFSSGKYFFTETYRLKVFTSNQSELRNAVKECAVWYEKGMHEQTIELWNITTVAEMFNKHRQNIHRYYKEGKLPSPFAVVKDVPYWHPKQIGELSRAIKS